VAAHATTADLLAVPGVASVPAGAEQLLLRASRDVDQALICAVYDVADPDVVEALRDATVEQALANAADGDKTGLGGQGPQSFNIGGLNVSKWYGEGRSVRRVGRLAEQAWLILQHAGLTGQAPQDL
jgi:hypothetical protein